MYFEHGKKMRLSLVLLGMSDTLRIYSSNLLIRSTIITVLNFFVGLLIKSKICAISTIKQMINQCQMYVLLLRSHFGDCILKDELALFPIKTIILLACDPFLSWMYWHSIQQYIFYPPFKQQSLVADYCQLPWNVQIMWIRASILENILENGLKRWKIMKIKWMYL